MEDELRRKAVSRWLPSSGYELRDAPEIGVIHRFWEEGNEKLNHSRYCELWLPIEKNDKFHTEALREQKHFRRASFYGMQFYLR